MTPAQQAARDLLAEAVAAAQARIPAWAGLPPFTPAGDLEQAVAGTAAWLLGSVLPWMADSDWGTRALPPLREPGTS